MDILEIIRRTIETLPDGPHLAGLRSVLRHIEAAYKHFSRAQTDNDESGFTDAIYRTNQAFEGSIKEAYRVIEKKDPQRMAPREIEEYFEEKQVFRGRILAQFTNYRREWRNPSTHDYNLDFDEDEAFLAIVSVSAFAKLLIDQIAEKLSFAAAQKDVKAHKGRLDAEPTSGQSLGRRVIRLFQEFAKHYTTNETSVRIESEAQLMGALAGFLSTVAPDIKFVTGRVYRKDKPYYVDMEISRGDELLLVELKRGQHRALIDQGLNQLRLYCEVAKAKEGLLFLYSGKATEYIEDEYHYLSSDLKLYVLHPNAAA
jgi:hypothetical protein